MWVGECKQKEKSQQRQAKRDRKKTKVVSEVTIKRHIDRRIAEISNDLCWNWLSVLDGFYRRRITYPLNGHNPKIPRDRQRNSVRIKNDKNNSILRFESS